MFFILFDVLNIFFYNKTCNFYSRFLPLLGLVALVFLDSAAREEIGVQHGPTLRLKVAAARPPPRHILVNKRPVT